MNTFQHEALYRVYRTEPVTVASGESVIIDVRGLHALVPYLTGLGTATYQPWHGPETDDGAEQGTAAAALESETAIDVNANFYQITAAGGQPCIIHLLA